MIGFTIGGQNFTLKGRDYTVKVRIKIFFLKLNLIFSVSVIVLLRHDVPFRVRASRLHELLGVRRSVFVRVLHHLRHPKEANRYCESCVTRFLVIFYFIRMDFD